MKVTGEMKIYKLLRQTTVLLHLFRTTEHLTVIRENVARALQTLNISFPWVSLFKAQRMWQRKQNRAFTHPDEYHNN